MLDARRGAKFRPYRAESRVTYTLGGAQGYHMTSPRDCVHPDREGKRRMIGKARLIALILCLDLFERRLAGERLLPSGF